MLEGKQQIARFGTECEEMLEHYRYQSMVQLLKKDDFDSSFVTIVRPGPSTPT